jgi:hypothetical protein
MKLKNMLVYLKKGLKICSKVKYASALILLKCRVACTLSFYLYRQPVYFSASGNANLFLLTG